VPVDEPEMTPDSRPLRLGGTRRGAGEARTPGLVTQVGDPGLGEVVADARVRVHRGLLGRTCLYIEDAAKAGRRGSGEFLVFSGVLVQWLIDPGRAPSPAELALGLQAIAEQVTAAKPG